MVCSTLSAAGSAAMIEACADAGGDTPFDVVIVDEAAQGLETSLLIPLRYSAQHCILVGDPQQLPATVFSQLAESKQFSRSLFERLQVCAACTCLVASKPFFQRLIAPAALRHRPARLHFAAPASLHRALATRRC